MSKEEEAKETTGALARFESGGDLGPIEDRNEYDQRLESLAFRTRRNWRRKAHGLQTSANTSSARGWTFPWRFLINLDVLSRLAIPERIEAMKKHQTRD